MAQLEKLEIALLVMTGMMLGGAICTIYMAHYGAEAVRSIALVRGVVTRALFNTTLTSESFVAKNLYQGCTVPADMMCSRIQYRDVDSAEKFLETFASPRWPVIIEGTDQFRALGWNTANWTQQYLMDKLGSKMVQFEMKTAANQTFGQHTKKDVKPMKEFLDRFWSPSTIDFSSEQWYLNLQTSNTNAPPQTQREPGETPKMMDVPLSLISADFNAPGFFLSRELHAVNMWMGRSDPHDGSISDLHFDGSDNIYALVQGRKRIKLWSPNDTFNVYTKDSLDRVDPAGLVIHDGSEEHPNFSAIGNVDAPDVYERFPRFRNAKTLTCDVAAGEFLFIPAGWWHAVRSFDRNIAINFWAFSPPVVPPRDREHCAPTGVFAICVL